MHRVFLAADGNASQWFSTSFRINLISRKNTTRHFFSLSSPLPDLKKRGTILSISIRLQAPHEPGCFPVVPSGWESQGLLEQSPRQTGRSTYGASCLPAGGLRETYVVGPRVQPLWGEGYVGHICMAARLHAPHQSHCRPGGRQLNDPCGFKPPSQALHASPSFLIYAAEPRRSLSFQEPGGGRRSSRVYAFRIVLVFF